MTTPEEQAVLSHLANAWNAFVVLERTDPGHPDNLTEFKDGIHRCQSVLAHRLAVRVDPEVWDSSSNTR